MRKGTDLANFIIVEPAENTSAKTLRGCFSGQICRRNANVNGAVIVALEICTESRSLSVGLLGIDYKKGCISGKLVHSHAHNRLCDLASDVFLANRLVIGLTVASRGR